MELISVGDKKSTVKEHDKYLKDGKPHLWRSHDRYMHEGRTESNTENHKSFVDWFIGLHMNNIDVGSKKEYHKEQRIGDRHICDVLISVVKGNNIKRYCVECQLSRISRRELYDRTFYYLHNSYEVVWVIPHSYSITEHIFSRLGRYCLHLGYNVKLLETTNGHAIFVITHSYEV